MIYILWCTIRPEQFIMKNLEKSNKFYDTYSMGNNSSSTI